MKKNDWLIIISTAAYSFLFYEQSAGLNFLLFNIVLIALLLFREKTLALRPAWAAAAAGSLISSFFVFKYGTWLPIFANLCSLLMLEGFSFNAESSLLISAVNSCFSMVAIIPVSLGKLFSPNNQEPTSGSIFRKIPLLLIPVFVTAIFFFLYRASNPVFAKYADEIDFDFISFGWIFFTLIGFILMIGFFRHQHISWLTQTDQDANDRLNPISLEEHLAIPQLFTPSNEFITGVILFSMLNLLLLSVNSLDVYFMWIVNKIPEGVTVAEYLHDGTDTLIISICLAIAVILFVFRGYLNFFEKNKWLKLLAYGWIAQNALLVITTLHRNWWIIQSSGLTRRRIGVYVYLLLCLIGLTTTFIKVAQANSNWFLFRKNAWAFYLVFIVGCFINWDDFIVRYNCRHFKALEFEYIDRNYQADLSYTCLASLFEYYKKEKTETTGTNKIFTNEIIAGMYGNYHDLKAEVDSASWKSYCLSKTANVKAIDEMIAKGEVEKK